MDNWYSSYLGEPIPRVFPLVTGVIERLLAAGYHVDGRPFSAHRPNPRYTISVYTPGLPFTGKVLCRMDLEAGLIELAEVTRESIGVRKNLVCLDVADPQCFDFIDSYLARIVNEKNK